MRNSLFVFLMLLMIPILCLGQEHPITKTNVPKKYLLPKCNIDLPNDKDEVLNNSIWIVYSDRDSNQVFLDETLTRRGKSISFLQKCYVLKKKNEKLLIGWPQFTKSGKEEFLQSDTGWISANNLILWSHCCVNQSIFMGILDTLLLDSKLLILNKYDNDDLQNLETNPALYKAPSFTNKIGDLKSFDFYYVYKKSNDGEFYLIGDSTAFNHGNNDDLRINKVIKGWVPKNYCVEWNHRIALEPNYDTNAITERKWSDNQNSTNFNNGIIIFDEFSSAKNFYKSFSGNQRFIDFNQFDGIGNIVHIENPLYIARKNDCLNRFFLLDNETNSNNSINEKIHKVGFITKTFFPRLCEDTLRKIKTLIINRRKVNLIFVIDASSSLTSPETHINIITGIETAIESINKANNSLSQPQSHQRLDIRIGIVLYRDDYAENHLVDVLNLNNSISSSRQWLLDSFVSEYNKSDVNDQDYTEALYYGLNVAIDTFDINKNETNYLFIIGDAGDHQDTAKTSYVIENTLIEKISESNFSIIGYGIPSTNMQNSENVSNIFINQLKTIIEGSRVMKNYRLNRSFTLSYNSNDSTYSFQEGLTSPSIKKGNGHQRDLSQFITNSILTINEKTNQDILTCSEILLKIDNGTIEYFGDISVLVTNLIINGASDAFILRLLNQLKYYYKEGYAIYELRRRNYPDFKYVFLTEQYKYEKYKVFINEISQITDIIGDDILRKKIANQMSWLINIMRGEISEKDYLQDDFNSISFFHLIKCLTGYSLGDKYLNWTINNVLNEKEIVKKTDISGFINSCKKVNKKFLEYSNLNCCHFNIGNKVYYWIDESLVNLN